MPHHPDCPNMSLSKKEKWTQNVPRKMLVATVSLHVDKYGNFQGRQRQEKVDEVLSGLKKQNSVLLTAERSVTLR